MPRVALDSYLGATSRWKSGRGESSPSDFYEGDLTAPSTDTRTTPYLIESDLLFEGGESWEVLVGTVTGRRLARRFVGQRGSRGHTSALTLAELAVRPSASGDE